MWDLGSSLCSKNPFSIILLVVQGSSSQFITHGKPGTSNTQCPKKMRTVAWNHTCNIHQKELKAQRVHLLQNTECTSACKVSTVKAIFSELCHWLHGQREESSSSAALTVQAFHEEIWHKHYADDLFLHPLTVDSGLRVSAITSCR